MTERGGARARSFGPTVLLGLGGAVLAAVAASQDWARASGSAAGVDVAASVKGSESAPLAVALALVGLASWGVVLVLRGRLRQVVALVGVLASAGVLVATLTRVGRVRDDAIRAVVARGGTGDAFDTSVTPWFVVCAGAAAVTLACFLVAVLRSPGWPAMGSRYDAPAGRAHRSGTAGTAAPGAEGEVGEQEMWRALDDGRDPTA